MKLFLFFTFFYSLLFDNAFGQNKHSLRPKELSQFEREIAQRVPDGALGAKKSNHLINFYIDEMAHIKTYSFNGKDTARTDSLLPIFRRFINEFLKNYSAKIQVELNDLKDPLFNSIYHKIESLSRNQFGDEKGAQEIKTLISSLPISRKKVWLFLQYNYLNLDNKNKWDKAGNLIDQAKEITSQITDTVQKGKAYRYIGDFANYYYYTPYAIQCYYLSLECFNNSKIIDSLTKYECGITYEKLADTYIDLNLSQSYERSIELYKVATSYFYSSGNLKEGDESNFNSLADEAYLIDQFKSDYSDSELDEKELKTLISLEKWYSDYKKGKFIVGGTNYLGLYTIAEIMAAEQQPYISLKYFLSAFSNVFKIKEIRPIGYCLQNISALYALQHEEQLALDYSNLEIYLYQKSNDKLGFYKACIDKAYNFNTLGMNDSALILVNKIQFDTSILNSFQQPTTDGLLKDIYNLKSLIFSTKSLTDSSMQYERWYNDFRWKDLENFNEDLSTEAESITDWIERTANKKIDEEVIAVKNTRENAFYIGIAIIILGLATVKIVQLRKKAEFNRVNELAKNKIHNIENDYSEIGNLLADNRIDELKAYNEKYESFLAIFLDNWKKDRRITLNDELQAFERYAESKKILNSNLNWEIKNYCENPEKIMFIQSVFDTLFDNFSKNVMDYNISNPIFEIEIRKEKDHLTCRITDNGKPPETDADYLSRSKSGLNILKKRILLFSMQRKLKFKRKIFQISSLPNKTGTLIYIRIPCRNIKLS